MLQGGMAYIYGAKGANDAVKTQLAIQKQIHDYEMRIWQMAKHLLKLMDLSKEEIIEILDLADKLKYERKNGIAHPILAGKKLGMIFPREKNMYVGDLLDSWTQWGPELCVWRNGDALCFADVYEAEAQTRELPMEAVEFAKECYGTKMCVDIPTGEDKRKKKKSAVSVRRCLLHCCSV